MIAFERGHCGLKIIRCKLGCYSRKFSAIVDQTVKTWYNLPKVTFKVTQVINVGTIGKGIYDFLLVINSNYGPISHRFRDTAVDRKKMNDRKIQTQTPTPGAPLGRSTPKWKRTCRRPVSCIMQNFTAIGCAVSEKSVTAQKNEWQTDWLTDWLNEWLTELHCEFLSCSCIAAKNWSRFACTV